MEITLETTLRHNDDLNGVYFIFLRRILLK